MRPYRVEIDRIDAARWHRLLQDFDDANLFQTWGYGAARWGEDNLSHAVIEADGEVVGLAQSLLVRAPLLGPVLAYVTFGPVCQRRGAGVNADHLQATIEALREAYVVRRRLCLRLRPWAYDLPGAARTALLATGAWSQMRPLHASYIVDLSRAESELRRAMDRKWRANLRRAEGSGLTVTQPGLGAGSALFLELHRQMRRRKRFRSGFEALLPALQRGLPELLQPRVFVCWRDRLPVAAALVSAIGDRAFYVNGASGDAGLELRGGHFLQWAIVRWLKQAGRSRWYDLHGVASSPGVRQFKRGLVGARAAAVAMPELEARGGPLASLVVGAGNRLYDTQGWLRGRARAAAQLARRTTPGRPPG